MGRRDQQEWEDDGAWMGAGATAAPYIQVHALQSHSKIGNGPWIHFAAL